MRVESECINSLQKQSVTAKALHYNFFNSQLSTLNSQLKKKVSAYRLYNDVANGIAVDRYNEHFQIQFFNKNSVKREQELVQDLKEKFSPKFIAVKYRFKDYCEIKAVLGTDSKTVVEEYGCKFAVDLMDTLNPGLFLDMREARRLFGTMCKGKEVLNLFAYTCSFSVHARKNGALKAVNVDISKKNLNKGKENYLLNDIDALSGEFFCGSSEEYVDWALKKGKKFGAIVIDPPSFAKNGKKTFSVANDFENLAAKAAGVLESDGIMLLATNYSEWNGDILLDMAKRVLGKRVKILAKGTQGEDFPGSGLSKESCLNWVVVKQCLIS